MGKSGQQIADAVFVIQGMAQGHGGIQEVTVAGPSRTRSGYLASSSSVTMRCALGQTGDLKHGLPLQAVAVGNRDPHEPMQLSVLIQAPLHRIGTIISRNQVLRNLFDNNWITLTARNDQHSSWCRYSEYGWITDSPLGETKQGD